MTEEWEIKARVKGTTTVRNDRSLVLDSVKEHGADFSGRKLDYFCAITSRFEKCRFEKLSISDACFGGGTSDSEYYDCSFDSSKIASGAPGHAKFVHCSFRNVLIRELCCHEVQFISCVFSGRFLSGYFNGSVLEERAGHRKRNEFRGNDFSQMEFVDVAFRTGIDLTLQKLPTGPNYLYLPDAPSAVAKVRRQVIEWTDLDLRKNGMIVIQLLEGELQGGQQQLFLSTKVPPPPKLRKAKEVIFKMLGQV